MKGLGKISRRAFNLMVAGAATVKRGYCVDPDVSFAIVPDPQYLAFFCQTGYSGIMAFIRDNVGTIVDGAALNTIGAIGVGDCVQTPNSGGETSAAVTAWGVLDTASIPFITPPGNHDMGTSAADRDFSTRSTVTNQLLSNAFISGGFFSATNRSAKSYFGGSFDSSGANTYISVGSYIIIAMEFFPRSQVMEWAKNICLSNPSKNIIITTHGYMTDSGTVYPRTLGSWSPTTTYPIGSHATVNADRWVYKSLQDGNIGNTPSTSPAFWQQWSPWWNQQYPVADNPDAYLMGAAPLSNCGLEMWDGSVGHDPNNGGAIVTWTGLKLLPNVQAIVCGHYVYENYHTDPGTGPTGPWHWNQQSITSSSARAQNVTQLYCNHQDVDNTGGGCATSTLPGAAVYFIRIKPSAGVIQGYGFSLTGSKWIGSFSSPLNVTPVKLFEVPYSPVATVSRFMISQ